MHHGLMQPQEPQNTVQFFLAFHDYLQKSFKITTNCEQFPPKKRKVVYE